MQRIPTLLLSVLALSGQGCEQAVDLRGLAPAQIVVESRLRAGAAVRVDVRVIDSFGKPTDSEGLEGTTGTITSSVGQVGQLRVTAYSDSTAVLSIDSLDVLELATYTLELDAPGFATLRSVTTVPPSVQLDTLEQTKPLRDTLRTGLIEVPVAFEDPTGENNYFHLLIWLRDDHPNSELAEPRRPLRSNLVTPISSLPSLYGSWHFSDFAFRDARFNGSLTFDLADLVDLKYPVAILELRTVTQAYHTYYMSRGLATGGASPIGPDLRTDNISGGAGVFGSYSSTYQLITLSR